MHCLITGASRGLGKVLARRFWNAGYSLALAGRSTAALKAACDEFDECPGQSRHYFEVDLAKAESVRSLGLKVAQQIGELDVLINNAAIQGPIGPLMENDIGEWREAIEVNLLAPVELSRALIPCLSNGGGGAIINLSGGGATGPRPNFSAYATAKTALVRVGEILAEELRPLAIRVNSVAPGAMKTSMLAQVIDQGASAAGQREFDLAEKVFQD